MDPTQNTPRQNTESQQENLDNNHQPPNPSTEPSIQATPSSKNTQKISNTGYKLLGIVFCVVLVIIGISNAMQLLSNEHINGTFAAEGCALYSFGGHGGHNYKCAGVFTPSDPGIRPTTFGGSSGGYVTALDDISRTTVPSFELASADQAAVANGSEVVIDGERGSSPLYWIILVVASGLVILFLIYSFIRQYQKRA